MSDSIKVLIIDDDPATADMLKIIISQITSEIHTAGSGRECIHLVQKQSPDIIILDLVMPDMSGADACLEIRKFSNIPILVLSALDDPAIVAKTLNSGADNFLSKPVSSAMLLAHIQKLVQRSRSENSISFRANSRTSFIYNRF